MRMLTYKFLSTIIDDLFAFIIKMPTLHRIACFRDDVIFVIFLYQKVNLPCAVCVCVVCVLVCLSAAVVLHRKCAP